MGTGWGMRALALFVMSLCIIALMIGIFVLAS